MKWQATSPGTPGPSHRSRKNFFIQFEALCDSRDETLDGAAWSSMCFAPRLCVFNCRYAEGRPHTKSHAFVMAHVSRYIKVF